VGEPISWTLRGFHNRTGVAVDDFSIIDMPGLGLNFASGSLPAFANGAGVTYTIRYRVAGDNQWRTHATNINAAAPFTFSLPQPGNLQYTEIRFDFGTVPANFGLGDTIRLTFIAGDNAPNNTLVNNFVMLYNNRNVPGESPDRPIVIPRPPTNGNLIPNGNGNGYIELDDNDTPMGEWIWNGNEWDFIEADNGGIPLGRIPQTGLQGYSQWLISFIFLTITTGLGTLCFMLAKKRKNKGVR